MADPEELVPDDVLVVGGGIIGAAVAYRLRREGARVTLVEGRRDVAGATSHANGGQLSFASAGTWSGAELAHFLLRGFFQHRERPWRLAPRAAGAALLWGLRPRGRADERLRALVRLSALEFGRFLAEDPTLRPLVEGHGVWALREHGRGRSSVAGLPAPVRLGEGEAIFHAGDAYGDCRLFTLALAERFRAAGGRLLTGIDVRALELRSDGVRAVGREGAFRAERVVVAAGLGSLSLLKPLGARPPLFPVQGYSLTYPCPPETPRFALLDEERKVVLTRLGDGLRVAGLLDLGRRDEDPCPSMLGRLEAVARRWLPDLVAGTTPREPWACVRAMAPGGVPFLGACAGGRIVYAVGHGHLGWTLAAGSARLVSDLLADRVPPLPFSDYALRGSRSEGRL
jgi:D-amino-acid dehydrogenase